MMLSRASLPAWVSAGLLIVVMGLLSVHTLTSIYQDIGRHITLGRIIWATHQVPHTNLFSYTARDFPFINHHWLGEVGLYLGDRLVGLKGLIMTKALMVAFAYALALGASWRSRMALPAMGVGLVSMLIMVERTDVRPEIASFIFFAWYLFVFYRKPTSRLVWTLPLVQLLWVNTHIYFFMGPLVLVAFWIGDMVRQGWPAVRSRHWWVLAGLVALATLCNPSGLAGALYPFHIFSNYGYRIVENQSPFFLKGFGYPQMTSLAMYSGLVLAAVSFMVNAGRWKENIPSFILAVTTGVLALTMVRNFPLFALVLMPVVLQNLDQARWHWQSRQWLWPGMAFVALFGVSVVTNQVYTQAGMLGRSFGLNVPIGPQASIDFFINSGLRGPIFNNFDVGSFLIWKLPQEPVFIDGRPEAYPAAFIQDVYIRMQESPQAWQKYVEQYHINTIFWAYSDITPWSQAFVVRILKDPQWKLVYRDGTIMILTRKNG